MAQTVLGWLAWLQDRDIEGTALSFVVCQLTLAIAASADTWLAMHAAVLLFLPTVFLAAFFLRFVEGSFVLLTAFVATWYFIVPPRSSFALDTHGAVELAIFVFVSCAIVVGAVTVRKLVKRRPPRRAGMLQAKADLMMDS
jgi:K+-sensing histidine kinase KdpD